jgi:hypothetical protein
VGISEKLSPGAIPLVNSCICNILNLAKIGNAWLLIPSLPFSTGL